MDDLFEHSAQTAAGTVSWVRQHRLRLQEVHHKALDQLKQAAADTTRYTDKRAADHALQVSDHVYKRVLGRNKIQDCWRLELHRVISQPFDDRHVYIIQPLAGGAEHAVHRKDLMPAATPLVMDSDHQPQPPSPDDCDSESHSDDELCLVLTPRIPAPAAVVLPPVQEHPPGGQTPPQALDVAPPLASTVPQPRRSRNLAEKNN